MDETVDTFDHVKDDKPDPELEEHDGKVHVGDYEIIGLADAVNTNVSEKLTAARGFKFLQTEDSEKKTKLCRKDDIL